MNNQQSIKEKTLAFFNAINEKNLQYILDSYADDGEVVHPFGVFKGKAMLEQFYGGLVLKADTHLSFGRIAVDNNICAIELIAVSPQAPDRPQYALDIIEFDLAGKIRNLSVYYRNFDLK